MSYYTQQYYTQETTFVEMIASLHTDDLLDHSDGDTITRNRFSVILDRSVVNCTSNNCVVNPTDS